MAQIILDSANNLIQGDFDTATLSLRTRMQTSTTNATTGVYVVPNGSATSASVQVSNAADPTNASKVVVATNGATDTQIVSGANGSGSYLPLSFYTNNDIRFQMGNAGELNVRTAPGTVSSGTSGQFLTSGGPGAGVSWTTAAGYTGPTATIFTTPGTFTIPASTTKIKVTVVGGGGSGGARNGGGAVGGAAGGAAIKYLSGLTGGNTLAITVGSGGSSATSDNSGNSGNTSSVASGTQPITTISATGGSGGPQGPGFVPGVSGGIGSNGDINIRGGGSATISTASGIWSAGGNSLVGGGGYSGGPAVPGGAGTQGGGGGAGAPASGAGGTGIVIVEF